MALWSVSQLSKASGVSGVYIRRLLRQGKIAGQMVGRSWVIQENEALRWLAGREAKEAEQGKLDVEGLALSE